MIGACDCCDRQHVPVSRFRADQTSAQCETTACYLCHGETDADPYGELPEAIAAARADERAKCAKIADKVAINAERRAGCHVPQSAAQEAALNKMEGAQEAAHRIRTCSLSSHQGNCK